MKKKVILTVIVLAVIGVGGGAYYMRRGGPEPQVSTAQLSRGDIVDAVSATGTLEAVETVDVGTQVSGVVQNLYADFNTIVRKGQIIARLDPSLLQTQVEQNRANVSRAEAELERLRVALADARQKLDRAQQMSERNLIPRTDLETAEVNVKSAEAQIRSAQAALTQARANLNQSQVNLQHTIIDAPIDGIVIARNVDVGQTVAASMQAPTLYVIAADLTKMQVLANIDEADVGRMRPNQPVTFRVDAYPSDTFSGTVQQVRLQPAVVQNVVTYSTVISVPNRDLKLKPGMTANVNIEIARRSNVLRIPNAALRFRPTTDTFAALNQPVPPEFERMMAAGRGQFGRGGGQGGGQGAGGGGQPSQSAGATQAKPQGAAAQPQSPTQQGSGPTASGRESGTSQARGGGDATGAERATADGRGGFDPNMTPEERRKRFEERLATMSPEERERIMARMREGGGRFGGGTAGDGGRGNAPASGTTGTRGTNRAQGRTGANTDSSLASKATTIDALFGPLPIVESRGFAWLWVNKQLKPVRLRLGVSDGTYTEIMNADELQPGMEVVLNVTTGLEPQPRAGQGGANNPLMGPQRGMPGRGQGGGGTPGRGR